MESCLISNSLQAVEKLSWDVTPDWFEVNEEVQIKILHWYLFIKLNVRQSGTSIMQTLDNSIQIFEGRCKKKCVHISSFYALRSNYEGYFYKLRCCYSARNKYIILEILSSIQFFLSLYEYCCCWPFLMIKEQAGCIFQSGEKDYESDNLMN